MKQPKWLLPIIVIGIFLLGVVVAKNLGYNVLFLGGNEMPSFAFLEEEVQNYVSNPIKPVEADFESRIVSVDLLDKKIDRLSQCESGGDERIINPDDGGSPSFGKFQYKEATWHHYLDLYPEILPFTERAERMNLIFDGETQRQLTKKILEEEKEGSRNWLNCWNLITRTGE